DGADAAPDVPEIDLDLPSPAAELPERSAPITAPELPAVLGELPLRAPDASIGLPSPASVLPAPLSDPPVRTPGAGVDLPSPASELPVPLTDLPSVAPRRYSEAPTSLPGHAPPPSLVAPPPPPAAPSSPDAGLSLVPTGRSFGDLELPLPPRTPSGTRAAEVSALDSDPFGEAELPPPRSLGSGPRHATSTSGVMREAGGGTSFGEVNLEEDDPTSLEASLPEARDSAEEDMEFGAVPQEDPGRISAAVPRPASAEVSDAEQAPAVRKRLGARLLAGLFVVATGGASLALVPEIGPFGAHWIIDRVRAGEYAAIVADTVKQARASLGRDVAPVAARAFTSATEAQAKAKRAPSLAAYVAFIAYAHELRFGADSAMHARATVLLEELEDESEADVPYLGLSRAARAATEGQLARARQGLDAILQRDPRDIDALVVSGEVALRARDSKAAISTWQRLAAVESSARAAYGLARAHFQAGDRERAERHAREALTRNPEHVGARILLARIDAGERARQAEAVKALEAVLAARDGASRDELASVYTLLGDIHLERSRISRAEGAYREALKLDPNAGAALSGLGEALFRAGRYSEAQARFEAGAQKSPDELAAKVGVAKSKLMLERVEEALSSLRKLREAHAASVLVKYWLGRALEAAGAREQAEEAYRSAVQQKDASDPMLVEAYIALAELENQQGKGERASATLSEARERFPSSPAIHRALGEVALTQGRNIDAKEHFDKALELDAEDLTARFKYGVALAREDAHTRALEVFEQVMAADPDFPGLALERGVIYEKLGKSDEALRQYEAARAKAPDDPDLMLRLGCGYAQAGRAKEAEPLLRKVVGLRPTSAETQHCLGRALLAGGSRLAEALRLLERAAELDPHRAEYHLYVGWAANEAGNVSKAQRALNEAIRLHQGLADAYWQRGVLRTRQGAVRDAVSDLTRALTISPNHHEARAALAEAYFDLGNMKAAIAELGKAVLGRPENADYRFRYGQLLAMNDKNDAARVELQRALELAEKTPEHERWTWMAHLLLAQAIGPRPESVPHWRAFLEHGPLDSPHRAEAQAIIARFAK
ncbi:MAG: tetratricopeptide repeat protein, partial [Pseudomonadota bacterium]